MGGSQERTSAVVLERGLRDVPKKSSCVLFVVSCRVRRWAEPDEDSAAKQSCPSLDPMPNLDPLARPLISWTSSDVDALLGRVEGERLELKGSETDINSASGRQRIARELAGMISSWGGFIVIGTVAGEDEVTAYPEITVSAAEVDAFRRSL
jgi:hypothetical protein